MPPPSIIAWHNLSLRSTSKVHKLCDYVVPLIEMAARHHFCVSPLGKAANREFWRRIAKAACSQAHSAATFFG
jgi:hypothetical protein